VLFSSYGLDKNTTCTETARTSEIHRTYRTRIDVNGRRWNTCKLVFLGTRIYGYSYSHSCLCERSLTLGPLRATRVCLNRVDGVMEGALGGAPSGWQALRRHRPDIDRSASFVFFFRRRAWMARDVTVVTWRPWRHSRRRKTVEL